MRRRQDRLVAEDHRVEKRVLLVEPVVHQLDVVLLQLLADRPAEGPRQEVADQPLGVLLRLRGGRARAGRKFSQNDSGRLSGIFGGVRFSASALATERGFSGTSPNRR